MLAGTDLHSYQLSCRRHGERHLGQHLDVWTWVVDWLFLPLLLLVVLARLALRRHTPAQIIVGVLIGVLGAVRD